MRQHVERLIQIALKQLQESGELLAIPAFIHIEVTKNKQYGDLTTNIAMILARLTQMKPRAIAEQVIQMLPASPYIEKVEIADPGFINFFLSPQALNDVVAKVLAEKETYGRHKIGRGKRILVEFLSSNPTGPLHVGHGRHAAFGAVVSNLLDAVGFKAYREYYLNDRGRQIDILAVSIWLRYLTLCGEPITIPTHAYQGDYVIEIAQSIYKQYQLHFHVQAEYVFCDLPAVNVSDNDQDHHHYMDALIKRTQQLLGDRYALIVDQGLKHILADVREDLVDFGIYYDNWFSERQFETTETTDKVIEKLKENKHVYEHDGALWFSATHFGDEKDRVLIRANGQRTYFANDIAYHWQKFERGFDIVIDIFGADHHGYLRRMKAAMEALGINPERLIVLLMQCVTLHHSHERSQMSRREGCVVPLRALREEVGNDATRFFYVMRKGDQPIHFDLALAKAQSNENPVYYIQYAYARICSVFRQLSERHIYFDEANGVSHLHRLAEREERRLLNTISRYPDMIINAALHYEPHLLTHYLHECAMDFHAYYDAHQFLVAEATLRDARLALIMAVQQILLNGFNLLGITALDHM